MLGTLLGTRDTSVSIPALMELAWKYIHVVSDSPTPPPPAHTHTLSPAVASPSFKVQLLSENVPDPSGPHCAACELNNSECLHDLFGT